MNPTPFYTAFHPVARIIQAAPEQLTWELKSPLLYVHNLQNRLGKINVHAMLTMHASPDLGIVEKTFGGRRWHMRIPVELQP
jgi:hypothetical protein